MAPRKGGVPFVEPTSLPYKAAAPEAVLSRYKCFTLSRSRVNKEKRRQVESSGREALCKYNNND